MATMDVKNVSWVEHMRQKFEALYVEVDETIYEDTVKYVGDHMRTVGDHVATVGETVKNFCSEVMQDLRASSSVDSAEEKYALLTGAHNGDVLACKNKKLDNENESIDDTSEQMGKETDGSAASNKCTAENSQGQFADSVTNQSTTVENYLNNWQEFDFPLKSLFDLSLQDSVKDFTSSNSQNETDESLCGCKDIAAIEPAAVRVSKRNENEVEISRDIEEGFPVASVVKQSQTKKTPIGDISTVLYDSVFAVKADVDTISVDNVGNVVEAGNEFTVFNPAANLQGGSKLEESCILVEKDDQFSKSTLENMPKSYKKKIKEAFFPRRWSKSKRDQLSASMGSTQIEISNTSKSFESEWELI
ncbi:uncharacterized protein LOC141599843 [Silene latifolia]|uniref:uncharacterized protein LOC141599843 n=1 Tax=Silene latifolia TaxID=37657 RepID=UPI003D78A508